MGLFRTKREPADEVAALQAALAKARNPKSVPNLRRRLLLGQLLLKNETWAAGERHYTDLVPALTDEFGPREPNTLAAWANLAYCQMSQGRPAEAIPLLERTAEAFEETWGARQPGTFKTRLLLAEAYGVAAQYEDALAVLDAHVDYCAAELGPAHALTRAGRRRKVIMLRALARYETAEQLLSAEDAFCETDEQRDALRGLLLVVRAEIGDPEAAIAPMRELFEKRPAQGESLAAVLLLAAQAPEAADLLRQALGQARGRGALTIRSVLARACVESGNLAEAEQSARAVLAAGAWPAGHPMVLGLRATLARAATRRGDRAGAAAELESVAAGLKAVLGEAHPRVAQATGWLAEC
ncbi:tetratricopeptide repeat protein [Amycolatopsis dendrobii]|uniref:Tetratricopeptide repeat protein n=1 Tax=Amycolatopsis dendrobii TaxID=2760662 RepID=A0A7W3VUE8_9PSEU|nr:tetratricopeptide repeat protein [Amycolatopsis dendrobii]MBB1153383.1 tetratricopeptide repeat protein [Amycolatopsis dendrobii]